MILSPASLTEAFKRNIEIIKMQTAGLSHEDSLVQLPFRGNCMNWIIGHILANRYDVLEVLGGTHHGDVASVGRYRRESAPILTDETEVLTLSELIASLDQAQSQIAALLAETSPEDLEQQVDVPGRRPRSIAEWLAFYYFHDTYHTGQTEILRQATGMNDKII
jgi:uncharacterized damage-inducible protein DinB